MMAGGGDGDEAAVGTHPAWTGSVNDPNGVKAVVCVVVFPALATLFVGVRIFARTVRQNILGLDDALIVTSLLLVWILAICAIIGWTVGLGRHAAFVPIHGLKIYLRGLYSWNLIYVANFTICKLSILIFYRRAFDCSVTTHRVIAAMIYFTIAWTLVFEIAFIFQCTPVSHFWTRLTDPEGGTCVDLTALYAAHAGTNVLTDLMIYIFPICVLWKLHISPKQKIALAAVFLAGAIVVGLSIARAVTIPEVVREDITWNQVNATIFCTLEISFGCIVACLPAVRSLWIIYGRPLSSRSNKSDSEGKMKAQRWPLPQIQHQGPHQQQPHESAKVTDMKPAHGAVEGSHTSSRGNTEETQEEGQRQDSKITDPDMILSSNSHTTDAADSKTRFAPPNTHSEESPDIDLEDGDHAGEERRRSRWRSSWRRGVRGPERPGTGGRASEGITLTSWLRVSRFPSSDD